MSKKNTQQNTRQRIAFFAVMFLGFLGTGVFAGINVFVAYQKNQDFSQVDAEEKFSRLPQYLLNDRALLRDESRVVRSSAARALGNLQSKEAISELNLLMKEEFDFSLPNSISCSAAESLGKLKAETAIPLLISLIEHDNDTSCIAKALHEIPAREVIPQLVARFESSNGRVGGDILITMQREDVIPPLNKLLEHPNSVMRFRAEMLVKSLKSSYFNVIAQQTIVDYDTKRALSKLKLKESDLFSGMYTAIPGRIFCRSLHENDSKYLQSFLSSNRRCYSNALPLDKITVFNQSYSQKIIPQLIELLQDSDASIRYSAAHLLGKLQVKKAIPQLLIAFDRSTGIEQYKMLETLVILDGLNESHLKKWMPEIVKDIERFDIFPDLDRKTLVIDISTQIYLKINQESKEFKVNLSPMNQLSRMRRDSQWILTGFALAAFLFLFVLTLFSLRELQRIVWQDHLICYFPEEVVGELIVLRRELTQAKKSKLLIETTLLYVIFTLIWAFYIQINIDNLWLPSKDQRRR
jgi:HEAT repeat protein